MLERVHIENYKCLRDVTVDLGQLTILIGPNDSGKSSFLDVLRTLGRVANESLPGIFAGDKSLANLIWRRQGKQKIIWEVNGETAGDDFVYHVELAADGGAPIESLDFQGKNIFDTKAVEDQREPAIDFGPFGIPLRPETTVLSYARSNANLASADQVRSLARVSSALESTVEFRFDPGMMSRPSVPRPDESLQPSGQNLAAFLDTLLTGSDRSAFAALEQDLHAAIPSVTGISFSAGQDPPGSKCLRFVLAGHGPEPVTIPASQASTGALLLTAFLALSRSKTPDLLLIEEPENGLHPSRLQLVVDVLRKMTTGELGGRKRQIILTTHNPLLLNFARPEEVRVFFTDSEKGTQIKNMADIPDADRLLKEFALGELWYLLGEEKLFKEQPA